MSVSAVRDQMILKKFSFSNVFNAKNSNTRKNNVSWKTPFVDIAIKKNIGIQCALLK